MDSELKPRITLRYPEFEKSYQIMIKLNSSKAYSFLDIDGISWFKLFINQVFEARDQKKYLPLYRMGDGEYNFVLGKDILLLTPLMQLPFRLKISKLKMSLIKKEGHKSGASKDPSESYSPEEYASLKEKYIKDLQFISEKGIFGLGLDNGKFYGPYFQFITEEFLKNNIILTSTNYYHVYHVYALFGSSYRVQLVKNQNILVITSLNPLKEGRIREALLTDGASRVDFYPISATKSMLDTIDLSKINSDVNLVFIGAGVGAANILTQLQPLCVPCMDIGAALSNMVDPLRIYDRPFMANDKCFDLEKFKFLSEKQKKKARKILQEAK